MRPDIQLVMNVLHVANRLGGSSASSLMAGITTCPVSSSCPFQLTTTMRASFGTAG